MFGHVDTINMFKYVYELWWILIVTLIIAVIVQCVLRVLKTLCANKILHIRSRASNINILMSITPVLLMRLLLSTRTHVADSRHWAGLYTSRGIWLRILYTWPLVSPSPTAGPRTRSSMWERWRSTPQSCGGWCWRWGRSAPVESSYTHAFSAIDNELV